MTKNFIAKNFVLNEDERIIKIIRQPKWKLLNLTPAIILIAAPFFFLFPLFSLGKKGIIVFFVSVVSGVFLLLRNLIIWYFNILVITNQRVIDIDQQKIFSRVVSDIPLDKVQDVFCQIKGLGQTLGRIGDIQILVNDGKTRIEARNIFRPQKIQQLILQLKLDYLQNKIKTTELSAQELVNLVKKIKEGLGEQDFERIVSQEEKQPEEK